MSSLVYLVAVSLDGFIAGPDGDVGAFRTDPAYLAALVARYPETMPTHVRGPLGISGPPRRFHRVVMGRRTHQVALDAGLSSGYRHLRQYVVTHDQDLPGDDTVTVHTQDPLALVRGLKAETGGDIWLCGGGTLAAQLIEEIDELELKVHPVVLGAGTPLFADPVATTRFTPGPDEDLGDGIRLHRYQAASASGTSPGHPR